MFKQDSGFPFYHPTESLARQFTRHYIESIELLPAPICKFFELLLVLIALIIKEIAETRLATAHELQELEKFKQQESQKYGCNSESTKLESQIKWNDSGVITQNISSNYEDYYKITTAPFYSLEVKYVAALRLLAVANMVTQTQDEMISNQKEIIRNTATKVKHLGSKIGELQSKVGELKRKKQTAPASMGRSKNTLIYWKEGPLKNILLCAFYLGDYWASGRKNLQRKEVDAVCRTIEELSGHNAHESPRDFLWDNYQSWFKKKYLWNQLKSM